jgi:hypothetical protein
MVNPDRMRQPLAVALTIASKPTASISNVKQAGALAE